MTQDLTKITPPYGLLDPQPPTKPSIDWSQVAPEYQWLARDRDGYGWLFRNKPVFGDECALFSDAPGGRADVFTSYRPGDCDWRDSLVRRPE